jgi:hypothetical protein
MIYIAIDKKNACLRFGKVYTIRTKISLEKMKLQNLNYFEYQRYSSKQVYQLIRNKLYKHHYQTITRDDRFRHVKQGAPDMFRMYDLLLETLYSIGFCTNCKFIMEHINGESSLCDNCERKN